MYVGIGRHQSARGEQRDAANNLGRVGGRAPCNPVAEGPANEVGPWLASLNGSDGVSG
jgi:hypothetical protein